MACAHTILVVDDDPATRALMATWFDLEGYDVRMARNGSEALTLLKDEVPCLMVVDLDMPVMDGAELRRRQLLMPSVSAVPFILVSAAHNAVRIARGLGIPDVIPKPIDADQLLRTVGLRCHTDHDALPGHPRRALMITSVGLPQFASIVAVLVVLILYTQRPRF